MLCTTLGQLKEYNPCKKGLETLLASLPECYNDTDPIGLDRILESNGLNDAIWALRMFEKKYSVKIAIKCAERVLHIFEAAYLDDKHPRLAIEAAKKWLKDPSEKNRIAANKAANKASATADTAATDREAIAATARAATTATTRAATTATTRATSTSARVAAAAASARAAAATALAVSATSCAACSNASASAAAASTSAAGRVSNEALLVETEFQKQLYLSIIKGDF
jgi:hypothetical protein